MGIVDFCVRNPVSVTVGIILAVLFGTIALLRLPVQMIPTVDRPEITVDDGVLRRRALWRWNAR